MVIVVGKWVLAGTQVRGGLFAKINCSSWLGCQDEIPSLVFGLEGNHRYIIPLNKNIRLFDLPTNLVGCAKNTPCSKKGNDFESIPPTYAIVERRPLFVD